MQGTSIEGSLAAISDKWWLWLVRGILAIVLGVIALAQPTAALLGLTIWLGAYFLVDGVVSLFHGFGEQPTGRSRWPLIIWGVIGILAGITIFARPLTSVLTLGVIIGVWAIIFGVLEVVNGIRLREVIDNEVWLIIGGVASVVFGILMLTNVLAGLLAVAFIIGIWALVVGVTLVLLSFRIKGMGSRLATA
jgi:uncharacterized membrane protein HdeD (DUF308 family)